MKTNLNDVINQFTAGSVKSEIYIWKLVFKMSINMYFKTYILGCEFCHAIYICEKT